MKKHCPSYFSMRRSWSLNTSPTLIIAQHQAIGPNVSLLGIISLNVIMENVTYVPQSFFFFFEPLSLSLTCLISLKFSKPFKLIKLNRATNIGYMKIQEH